MREYCLRTVALMRETLGDHAKRRAMQFAAR